MISNRLNAYLLIHAHTLFSSLGRLYRNPFSTLMTVMVISIALAFSSGFYLLVENLRQVSGSFVDSNQISLFLKHDITEDIGRKIIGNLKQHPKVNQAALITKEAALEEFQRYSGFREALDILETNPLPIVIQIKPIESLQQPAHLELLVAEFQRLPDVDFAQLDLQWIKRFQSIVEIAQRAVFIVSLLLGIGVSLIIGNTIRLELQNRREEIVITKLIGATNSFIRRPFLYTGFWFGFFGGILGPGIVTVVLLALKEPVQQLSLLYESRYNLEFLGVWDTTMIVLISSMLGILGAWLVLAYQLNSLNPD